jgi:hypothetical protein
MPYKSALKPQRQRLAGPVSQSIPCWGECKTDLIFNGCRFAWTFLLADVQFPIISIDFLRHFRLLVDIAAGRLMDTASSQSFPIISESSVAGGRCANIAPPFQELLRRFPEVGNLDKRLPLVSNIRWRAKAEFDQLERDGIIRGSGPHLFTWSGNRTGAQFKRLMFLLSIRVYHYIIIVFTC